MALQGVGPDGVSESASAQHSHFGFSDPNFFLQCNAWRMLVGWLQDAVRRLRCDNRLDIS